MTNVLPWIAAALLLIVTGIVTARGALRAEAWMGFAAASAAFAAFSSYAVAHEGIGFWKEHTRNLWGNQIWFDLLLAVCVSWVLIVPRARTQGMRLWGWLLFVLATGCIGLTAMASRLLWLERQAGTQTQSDSHG